MRGITTALALWLASTTMASAECGGGFQSFVQGLRQEAIAKGHDPATVARFFANARQDPKVLQADRRQGVFQLPFTEFARRLISNNRLSKGRAMAKRHGEF